MGDENNPIISVIMPTYNRGYIIKTAISSVLSQTFGNWELLVVDDGSLDNTETVVKESEDSRIRYIKLSRNHGACYARNCGLKAARGEYIAFLDSDNVWSKDYLASRVNFLNKNEGIVGGVFGFTELIKDGKKVASVPSDLYENELCKNDTNEVLIKKMFYENLIDTNTIVLKKICTDKVDGFDESLRRLQDWDYFFRILLFSGFKIKFVNDKLVTNYIREDSISRAENDTAYWAARVKFLKKYKEQYNKYNLLPDAVCQMCLMLNPYAGHDVLKNIMRLLTYSELQDVMLCIRDRFEQNEKWRTDLETNYLFCLDIHERENMILRVQEKWISLQQHRVSILNGLEKKFSRVAIYGYGFLGKSLKKEIEDQQLTLACIVDKNKEDETVGGIKIISPESMPANVDLVIVTAIRDFQQIKDEYEKDAPFLSLKVLIDEAYNNLRLD